MYKKGIDELEKGISVEITGQGEYYSFVPLILYNYFTPFGGLVDHW